jgi:hypothetical protein
LAARPQLRTALLLFASTLVVYNLNFQRIASGDTAAASLLPFTLWLDGSIAADRFYPYLAQHAPARTLGFIVKDGHAYSAYPIALPLLLSPLYAPAALLVRAGGWETGRVVILAGVLEKFAASLVAAVSVVFFYFLVKRLASSGWAMVVTLAYAFATETWTISSQALWQHGGSELAVIAGLFCLTRWWDAPERRGPLVMAGLSGALAAAIRPTNVLFLAAVCASLLLAPNRRRALVTFCAFPIVVGAAVAAYNWHIFGRIAGGYDNAFGTPFWQGFSGLVASPGRGLFVYTPVAVFSLVGTVIWLRSRGLRQAPAYVVSLLFSITHAVLVSKWSIWWGGHCYGPRLLTDIVPCLMLLIIPATGLISRGAVLRLLFGLSLLTASFIQAVGAFCYPNSHWDEAPVAVGARPQRLWDWKDSPISRSLRAGPRLGPDPGFRGRVRDIL